MIASKSLIPATASARDGSQRAVHFQAALRPTLEILVG
jgi:hypothetical protein